MKQLMIISALATACSLCVGCSQEDRDDAIRRTTGAARELNGGNGTPDVVREQRRLERQRQNSQWTAENQAKYPVEYCQAQLGEVRRFSEQLEVSEHKIAVALSAAKRKQSESETQVKVLGKFLEQAKSEYRLSETNHLATVKINGREVEKNDAQKAIVEAYQRLQSALANIPAQKAIIDKLNIKFQKVAEEQKKLAALSDRIKTTLEDVRMKKLVDGENGIGDALNAIGDSMGALSKDQIGLSLDDLLSPPAEVRQQETFEAIMAQ